MSSDVSTTATLYPRAEGGSEVVDFVAYLDSIVKRQSDDSPALVGPDGTRTKIPSALLRVLHVAAEVLMSGRAVTLAPMSTKLTTQEAADFLGISRPTLVRILDRGDLPMERPGRHRYIQLHDLIEYQEGTRRERSKVLDKMARDAEQVGMYEAADGTPPPMR